MRDVVSNILLRQLRRGANTVAQTDFTIADVLAWARTKPADEEYNFIRSGVCALGQYAREVCGFSLGDAACGYYSEFVSPDLLHAAAGSSDDECTFGLFVARLEALCPSAPVKQPDWAKLGAYMADIELASA